MPTGDAYSSGHLVPSHLGHAYVLLVETNDFPELVVIFPDYAIRTYLDTFSTFLTFHLILTRTTDEKSIPESRVWSIWLMIHVYETETIDPCE